MAKVELLLVLAKEKNLYVDSVPDILLEGVLQVMRHLLDEGTHGMPVTLCAYMLGRGLESFHPRPEFFYLPGIAHLIHMGHIM